jgi:NAD(P)-dependent dehydrogenase (short-subunit alcohol dehydrogenase family)
MQGKVAVVTGASTGIGRAVAVALAKEGVNVVVADVDADRGEKVVVDLEAWGAEAMFVETDVADAAAAERLVARTLERFGRLDYAVNNAGIEGTQAPTHECDLDNWHRTIAIDLTGVFLCMRAELPPMLEQGAGSIVNMSSVAGLVGFAGIPAYTASKHGIVGLTRSAALEYATQGVRVNAVCPGVIRTEMVDRFTNADPQAAAQMVEQMEPVGRMGTPEEIADAVVWLCSDRSSFVTGQAVAVDGGLVAR